MSWLTGHHRQSKGGFKPSFGGGLGLKESMSQHIIQPGVSFSEKMSLKKIKTYVEDQTNQPCTLPDHLIEDVYSMYVNKEIKRAPVTKRNKLKHMITDRVYNSLTKVLTNDSPLFSQMLTRELSIYMQQVQRELEEEQEKQGRGNGGDGDGEGQGVFDQGQGDGEGDEDGDGESGQGEGGPESGHSEGPGSKTNEKSSHGDLDQQALNKIMNRNERKLEQAVEKAEKKMDDLKQALGEEALDDLSNNEPDFLDKIDGLRDALSRISINKDSIRQVLVKILNESSNYFSLKYDRKDESIFDAEELDDVSGLEFLHPIFRNSQLMDVVNETRLYKGKIDLYLDCSGSMGSHENFEGTNVRMIDLVKGIAMILYRMNMIDRLYFFDNSLYEIKNVNEISILSFNRSGGTNFNKVVDQARINGRNSVCITDGEDDCRDYINNMFWVGVGGTKFTSYYNEEGAFKLYRGNRQCVSYNSRKNTFDYV